MNQTIKIQALTLALVLVSGCQKNEISEQNTTQQPTTSSQKEQTSVKDVKKAVEINKQKSTNAFSNNGEKITFDAPTLTKGTEVFNHAMQERGIATGAIYLTLKENSLPVELSSQYALKKMTNKSYRYLAEKDTDLLQVQNAFKQNANVDIVEIKVDYSPVKEVM